MASGIPIAPIAKSVSPRPLQTEKAVKADPQNAEMIRLRKAVADFEGLFLGYMLKSMQSTVPKTEKGLDSGGGVLKEVGWEQVAQSLARKGGLGLGDALFESLKDKVRSDSTETAELKPADPIEPKTRTAGIELIRRGLPAR